MAHHSLCRALVTPAQRCGLRTPQSAWYSLTTSSFSTAALDVVQKMRRTCISALANVPPANLGCAVDTCTQNFLFVARSKQHKNKLNAMDAIGLIKLCRKGGQPSRIGEIWPHIQQLSLLPAKDDRTTSTLIGSVISCVLEAKDPSTAASVWEFLRSFPNLPLAESAATRLLSALRGQPQLVADFITTLQRGAHGVCANAQHFSVAMQSLADSPDHCKQVFELALENNMVDKVTLVVLCQTLQRCKDFEGALNTLELANTLSITPEPAHYAVLLSCSAEMKSLAATKRVNDHLNAHPTSKTNTGTTGALLHSYAQCGDFENAASVFEQALKNQRIDGVILAVWCQALYQQKDYKGALNTLAIADSFRVTPEPAHYTVLLACAAEMNSLTATKRIHQHMNNRITTNNIIVGALVHSYSQCGDLQTAVHVFEDGLQGGLIFGVEQWNSVISIFTEHGMFKEAKTTLERMMTAGIKPNEVTVICLLNAASHAGMGLGVRQLYDKLQTQFPDIQLGTKHRSCVVDGLARAGLLEEAVSEARALEYDVAWTAVLGAARSYNRLDIAELAFGEIKRLCTDNSKLTPAHVLMSHIYTANGRDEEAAQMRRHIKDKRLHKLPGESSIEVDGVMHTFRANDTSHPEMKQIVDLNDKLHEQLKADGYVPDVLWASRGAEISNQTKEQLLCEHSERFALVYGLLHSSEGQSLTIFKNLRVCGDCHNATKHASKVLNRKLTVKDMNRWHVFENGKCSCGDFW